MNLAQTVRSDTTRPAEHEGFTLGIAKTLLAELHETKVVYCHWKSNEHVFAGLRGLTDLDILVERRTLRTADLALTRTGFKRFVAAPLNAYPAVQDYLAMDPETGRLVHVHLHYQLVAGEFHLKGYRLPWEHMILCTRQLDPQYGIYVIDPNLEVVLLFVRMALKLRARDRLLSWLGTEPVFQDTRAEFCWLRARVQPHLVCQLTSDLLGSAAAKSLQSMLFTGPSFHQMADFRRRIKPAVHRYRTYHPLIARVKRWARELYWVAGVVNKRYLHAAVPLRRLPAGGGLLVALLGCDGSGKSTQMKQLVKWLSWKVDVLPIYFGSGDGQSSLVRWPLKLAVAAVRRFNWPIGHPSTKTRCLGAEGTRLHSPLIAFAKVAWALALAYEKRSKLRKATKARNRGMIVICDRYPQNQINGFNDGPLLSHWLSHPSIVLRCFARWESAPYLASTIYPPDLVVKLNVTPEVAQRRKPDMHIAENQRRVNAVKALHYPSPTNTVDINADDTLDRVLLALKRCVWRELC
jgi:hypothetical protein